MMKVAITIFLMILTSCEFTEAQISIVASTSNNKSNSVAALDPNRAVTVYTPDLSIPTYDANTSVTHGNYVYFEAAWNGYKYWMVFTPYPTESRENPSIVVSNDGETWIEPPGITNPIDLLNTGDPYNSDPDIIYIPDEDKLYVIYRKTYNSSSLQEVKYRSSSDGVTWSSASILSSGTFQTESSFSFDYRGGMWHYWYIDTQGGGDADYEVYYKTAASITGLSAASATLCTISNVPTGYHNWQFDIIYDTAYSQYVGVMIYTLKNIGSPNNGGIAHFMTSVNKTDWTVATNKLPFPASPAQYLLSLQKTANSQKNGAAYEVIHSVQWKIKSTLIWLSDSEIVGDYDDVPGVESLFSVKTRLSSWSGLPLFRVKRSSDNDIIDVFYNIATGGLKLADGTALETYKSSADLEVIRWYNQSGFADYLTFTSGAAPFLIQNIWSGTTSWGVQFNGSDDVGESYIDSQFDGVGVTSALSLTSGRFWGVKSGSNYFGILTGSNISMLNGSNINTPHTAQPYVYTGMHGSSARIRRNGVQQVSGTTSNPDANKKQVVGAHWATSVYGSFFNGKVTEVAIWNISNTTDGIDIVEAQQLSDFPYTPNPVVSSNTVSVAGDVVGGTFVYYSPVSSAEKNIKPVAKNVVFTGTEQEGEDLTFSFTLENYTGYDGDNHILRIYKSDDARELNKTLVTTLYSDTETFPAYTLTASESNKYISATVQPNVAGGANPLGELAYSQSSGLIQSLFTSYLTTLFNDSQSQDLNGTSEYITQSSVGALTQPFELWLDVDVQGTSGSQRFWAFSNIIWVGLNGTSPEMRAGGTNYGFGTTTTTGRKTYRFVFNGASSFVQINDGTKYTITSSPGTSNTTNVSSYLGVNYALSGNYMNAYFYRWGIRNNSIMSDGDATALFALFGN